MHKHKLCRQLGISMKKFKKRLDDIKQRFGIQETDEQDGKQARSFSSLLPPFSACSCVHCGTDKEAVSAPWVVPSCRL